jgi:hypothetical protein
MKLKNNPLGFVLLTLSIGGGVSNILCYKAGCLQKS